MAKGGKGLLVLVLVIVVLRPARDGTGGQVERADVPDGIAGGEDEPARAARQVELPLIERRDPGHEELGVSLRAPVASHRDPHELILPDGTCEERQQRPAVLAPADRGTIAHRQRCGHGTGAIDHRDAVHR